MAERSRTREKLDTPPMFVVLLFTGHLAPIKTVDALSEAAPILRREGVRFQLLIAGEGECRDLPRLALEAGRPASDLAALVRPISRLAGPASRADPNSSRCQDYRLDR